MKIFTVVVVNRKVREFSHRRDELFRDARLITMKQQVKVANALLNVVGDENRQDVGSVPAHARCSDANWWVHREGGLDVMPNFEESEYLGHPKRRSVLRASRLNRRPSATRSKRKFRSGVREWR